MFHFHKWAKWVAYKEVFKDHHPSQIGTNWNAYDVTWTEAWEKRECEICGKHQQRRIKGGINGN